MNIANQMSQLLNPDDFEAIPTQLFFLELNKETLANSASSNKLPHRHSYQEIIWVRQGSAEHLLDGDIIAFPAKTLIIVPKGRIHRFYPTADCLGCVVRFKEEFLTSPSHVLFSQFTGHTAIHLSALQAEGIEAYFTMIKNEYNQSDPYHLQPLRHLLAALIAKLEELRLLDSQMIPHDFSRTLCIWNRFNTLIEQKYKTEHSVVFYASEMGLSTRKMGEIAKLYTGRYASELIDERLVVEAKRLILFSNLTIKEIAFELGFEEHSYFTKVFKKFTGKTPTNFKNQTFA